VRGCTGQNGIQEIMGKVPENSGATNGKEGGKPLDLVEHADIERTPVKGDLEEGTPWRRTCIR